MICVKHVLTQNPRAVHKDDEKLVQEVEQQNIVRRRRLGLRRKTQRDRQRCEPVLKVDATTVGRVSRNTGE